MTARRVGCVSILSGKPCCLRMEGVGLVANIESSFVGASLSPARPDVYYGLGEACGNSKKTYQGGYKHHDRPANPGVAGPPRQHFDDDISRAPSESRTYNIKPAIEQEYGCQLRCLLAHDLSTVKADHNARHQRDGKVGDSKGVLANYRGHFRDPH
jgi:hypothetical protein